jgi:hypothetical protein
VTIAETKIGIVTLLISSVFPVTAIPQKTENADGTANEFARKALNNELKAEAQDHSHWMLRLETSTSSGTEVDEVVETKQGDLKCRVALNGRPLSGKEEHDEDERVQKLTTNANALRKSQRDESEDTQRSQRMLRMLPDALIFSFAEHSGDTVELHFIPNPKFRPDSREAQVFKAMEGNMWINHKDMRLVGITGRLSHEVKFGGGLLGHLDPGGQFEVKQEKVASDYWELTFLNVNMKGKALFFKTIGVQQKFRRTEFRQVPDDLTLAQAADLLHQAIAANARAKVSQ